LRYRSIPNGDLLFRHAIFPNCYSKQRFVPEKVMYLKLKEGTENVLVGSLAWQKYVPTEKDVHDHGCRVARTMNRQFRAKGTPPSNTRFLYCGAYQMEARAIRALRNIDQLPEVLSSHVVHHIEEGEVAHTDLVVVLKQNQVTHLSGTKTAISVSLWNFSSGPLIHTCECDRDVAPHPNNKMSSAPGGGCVDVRSRWLRYWHVLRSKLCRSMTVTKMHELN
jgi:hypothetical protein